MPNRRWKKPNAQKHGVFSNAPIIPGEDPREFQQLLEEVAEEWQPDGTTEQDAVLTIAKGMWLKRRFQRFVEVQSMKNMADPEHPAYDEEIALSGFALLMEAQPETAFDKFASRGLSPDRVQYFTYKFPRKNFESTSEWAQAIINDIAFVLLPEVKIGSREAARHLAMITSAATYSGEAFVRELMLEERLNAMIDRATKRLIQSKAMKQVLGHAPKKPKGEPMKLPSEKAQPAKIRQLSPVPDAPVARSTKNG
ncbi:MAG: hypothetical protein WAM72_18920 [Xanthobacteraceae bacterium]